MGANRLPGPQRQVRSEQVIDLGTMCRQRSASVERTGFIQHQVELQRPLIYFFGGAGDGDDSFARFESAYNKIADSLKLPKIYGIQHYRVRDDVFKKYSDASHEKAFFTWDTDRLMVLARIFRSLRFNPLTPICLVGHSYGGDTAMDLAETLAASYGGIEVNLVVTLDPVSSKERITTANIKSLLGDVADYIKSGFDQKELGKFKYNGYSRTKPKNVNLWTNVWAEHNYDPIEPSNMVARLGGPWRAQAAADVDISMPKGVVHFDADEMFKEVQSYVANFPHYWRDKDKRKEQVRQFLDKLKGFRE